MSIAIKSRLLWFSLFVLSVPFGIAQTLPITFPFNGVETPLWDFTGSFQINDHMQGADNRDVALSFGIAVAHDARGRLRNSDQTLSSELTFLTVGGDTVAAHYVVTGSVGGRPNAPRVNLVIRLFGEDTIAGVVTKFNILIRYDLEVVEGVLQGKSRGSAKFAKLGNATIRNANVSVAIPPGMDGSWNLQMDIVPLKKLAGSGSIVLSNGRILPANLTGSLDSGRFKVKLTGINENAGGRMNLIFFEAAASPEILQGRILGQTVRK